MSKKWMYHATKEAIIIDAEDRQKYIDDGWGDSPAEFVKISDFGVDEKSPVHVQALGEIIESVADTADKMLNLEEMTKQELLDFADYLGVEVVKSKSKAFIIAEISKANDRERVH